MSVELSDLAVIVCTRNRPEMLTRSLESLAEHLPPEVDVLVVDSASDTDETREVAHAAGVGYVRADVPGLSIARNIGLLSTERSIVLFTDDDCLATPNIADNLVAAFIDESIGCVTGTMIDHQSVGPGGEPSGRRRIVRTLAGIDAGHGAAMAFRRTLVIRLGGFDETLGAGKYLGGAEDLDMFCRILWARSTIVHDASCVIVHAHTRYGDDYVQLMRNYGRGLGALVVKWLRVRPTIGIPMLVRVFTRAARRWVSNGDGHDRSASTAMISGLLDGMRTGRRLPLVGETFASATADARQ